MIRKKSVIKRPKVEVIGRSYKNYKHDKLKNDLDAHNWLPFDQSVDPSVKWDILHNVLEKSLDGICPLKIFKVPETKDEWMNEHLVNTLRDKNNLSAKARRTDKPDDWRAANLAKNIANRLSRSKTHSK